MFCCYKPIALEYSNTSARKISNEIFQLVEKTKMRKTTFAHILTQNIFLEKEREREAIFKVLQIMSKENVSQFEMKKFGTFKEVLFLYVFEKGAKISRFHFRIAQLLFYVCFLGGGGKKNLACSPVL